MKSLKGKKILILGGNALTSDIVLKAKELGVYTIVTDWNSPETSPAKKLADEYWMESISDIEKLSKDDLESVVGIKVAEAIIASREGKMQIHAGGGGNYGKVEVPQKN